MAEEFKAITTQEEFDSAIKSRLERERETVKKQFSDYEDLKKQITDLSKQVTDLTNEKATFGTDKKSLQDQLDAANLKIKGFEKESMRTNIAIEKGLPLELRSRLTGETEEELKADADSLLKLFGNQNKNSIPGFNAEPQGKDESSTAAYKELLAGLKLKEK